MSTDPTPAVAAEEHPSSPGAGGRADRTTAPTGTVVGATTPAVAAPTTPFLAPVPIVTADAPPALTGERLRTSAAAIHRELRDLLVDGGAHEPDVVAGLLRTVAAIELLNRQLRRALTGPAPISLRSATTARRSIRDAHALVAATCCSLGGRDPGAAADRA